ncbi:tail fiber domain-containing protein [Sinorhizobium meliloti]|uniref:tail fiber domain-containing protein n=1 Tax=Rhizobium meliloti TaxID=382 RepID=UPI000FD3DC1F|nr:tail fiber domain-containing protein [Sinorhizobium meliloti]RVL48486.1 tail fiber domain-containing protein [Sinorhizobium meliloti]RVL72419.1 tail fiber domain-containing protein [Sinorhizobium meliloti]
MSAPKAPDPAKTAAAQAQSNKETAIAQYGLNATNQVTPYGNLTYTQIGKWEDGTPRYQASTVLSPEQQKLYQQQTQLGGKLNDLALGQTDRLSGVLSQPVNLSNEATEGRLMELGRKRLDPLMAQRKASTEADLINRGIRPGTEAYNRAMTSVGQQENDAYNELLLKGRGQSVQETLAERNQPINEISALLSGGQVTSPQFVNTPTPGVNGTDVAGITNNAYQQQMAGYQSKMSGLLGLGTAIGGWAFSDRRLKSAIQRVGTHRLGIGVYEYDIAGGRQRGVMADEVAHVMPGAVRERGGYLQVNYDMIGGV